MEECTVTSFKKEHIDEAVALDKKWFGEHGASREDFLSIFSIENKHALALISSNGLKGFAVFDILDSNTAVTDYAGLVTEGKTAFIQQFTTESNYKCGNWRADSVLLAAVENYARCLNCQVVWEALSKNHPFAKNNNSDHDAYGFYEKTGYAVSMQHNIAWKDKIPCVLIHKNLT